MKTKPWLLWLVWSLAGAGLLVLVVLDEGTAMHPLTWAALLLGMAPLIGAQLALGSPKAAEAVKAWLEAHPRAWLVAAGVLSGFYLLTGVLTLHFDPYATVIFIAGLLAAFGTLREIQHGRRGLTWADLAVWLLLWIPFDLRWNYDLWFGPKGFAYNWWAVLLTVMAVLGWYGLRGLPVSATASPRAGKTSASHWSLPPFLRLSSSPWGWPSTSSPSRPRTPPR